MQRFFPKIVIYGVDKVSGVREVKEIYEVNEVIEVNEVNDISFANGIAARVVLSLTSNEAITSLTSLTSSSLPNNRREIKLFGRKNTGVGRKSF